MATVILVSHYLRFHDYATRIMLQTMKPLHLNLVKTELAAAMYVLYLFTYRGKVQIQQQQQTLQIIFFFLVYTVMSIFLQIVELSQVSVGTVISGFLKPL